MKNLINMEDLFKSNVEKCIEMDIDRKSDDYFYKVVPTEESSFLDFKNKMLAGNPYELQYEMKDAFDETKIVKIFIENSNDNTRPPAFRFKDIKWQP